MASLFVFAEDALALQHARMGNRAGDVLSIQASIESNRCCKSLDEGIGGLLETS